VAGSNYPREMRVNPFQQQVDKFSFDQQMALRAANRSQKEPTVYYNETTGKRGSAGWAMQQPEGHKVYPLGKVNIDDSAGKATNVAINETKLYQNYYETRSDPAAAALSDYLKKQGKEGITPSNRSRWEKVVDWWKGDEQPALIIKNKDGSYSGFNQNNQEIPMTNPPKQTQPKNIPNVKKDLGKKYGY
jgi:hypothetical protein